MKLQGTLRWYSMMKQVRNIVLWKWIIKSFLKVALHGVDDGSGGDNDNWYEIEILA